jgi:hypothetical protein
MHPEFSENSIGLTFVIFLSTCTSYAKENLKKPRTYGLNFDPSMQKVARREPVF